MVRDAESCAIFDDVKSISHFILGLLSKIVKQYNVTIVLLFYVIFIVYEIVEDKVTHGRGRAKCDILEYIIGYILADILL